MPIKKSDEAKINKVIADLWRKNLPTLLERLDLLDRTAEIATAGKLSESSRMEALEVAHKLSGSLGMFGYQQGTEIARKMEILLKSPTPETLVTLISLATDLRESLSSGL